MAGRIIYLEVDDEITSAAARIRSSEATRLAVVLPYGSRVATSRINFRLLSRDALTHEKRLSIVSGDPATRALAASAGLPVFSSVAEYETSVAGLDDEPREEDASGSVVSAAAMAGTAEEAAATAAGAAATETAGAGPGPAASPPEPVAPVAAASPAVAVEDAGTPIETAESDGTLGLVIPAAVVGAAAASPSVVVGETVRSPVSRAAPSPAAIPAEPVPRRAGPPAAGAGARSLGRGGIRTPWIIGAAILGLAILVAGVGAYLLLP